MSKAKLTDRQKYYTKAKGLPLFKTFKHEEYIAWVEEQEKAYLLKVNKTNLNGIKDHNDFNEYLRVTYDGDSNKS
jgi:hypothetical protein